MGLRRRVGPGSASRSTKDIVSGWGKATLSLHELATLSGIPGKMDVDGQHVAEMWLAGDVKGIVQYNVCDALTTYLVWLRIAHFGGFFTAQAYRDEQERVRVLIAEKAQTDLPPTIFGDTLKKQEVIAIPPLQYRHVSRQLACERQCE